MSGSPNEWSGLSKRQVTGLSNSELQALTVAVLMDSDADMVHSIASNPGVTPDEARAVPLILAGIGR
jgi:hypothetical protein